MVLQRLETSYLHSDIHAVFLPVIPATDPYTWYITLQEMGRAIYSTHTFMYFDFSQ